MTIELHMRPDLAPMSGDDFVALAGPFSIAIDGFVPEGPWFRPDVPAQCFNHHEGVERLQTRATCGQVQMAIRQDLFRAFRDQNGPRASVWANDCDEDVCLSWFLLQNHTMTAQIFNPPLNRLVDVVDKMDTTAGAYPFPEDTDVLMSLAWIFEPYRNFRLGGGLFVRSPDRFRSIVTDVGLRIMAHITGQGRRIPVDTTFSVAERFDDWVMVRETGQQARLGVFAAGHRAFVAVQERSEDRWSYTVGRSSEYINFPVLRILRALDEAEGLTGKADHWGGGSTIGGSPRIAGSQLSPKEVAAVINTLRHGAQT